VKFALVIPARLESTRLPRKLLADLDGRPLLWHTWSRALQALSHTSNEWKWAGLWIATDSEEIFRVATDWGAQVVMTSSQPRNGTERVAEAIDLIDEPVDAVINVQGDEPLIEPELLVALAHRLVQGPEKMVTPVCPLAPTEAEDPGSVKVAVSLMDRALYFSRSMIPYGRVDLMGIRTCWRHVGLYAMTLDLLAQWVNWDPTPLEQVESLEQLRLMEYGIAIGVLKWQQRVPPSVDLPNDLEQVRSIIEQLKES
jgi:3-deoxy-manno-octulosonate cytidylyltransferase (CMP-KDO synthetase)